MLKLSPEQIGLMAQLQQQPAQKGQRQLITQVLKLKTEGRTHKEIAAELGYSSSHIGKLSSLALKAYRALKGGDQ